MKKSKYQDCGSKLTPQEVYYELFNYALSMMEDGLSDDTMYRRANLYAVQNTVDTWRRQWKS